MNLHTWRYRLSKKRQFFCLLMIVLQPLSSFAQGIELPRPGFPAARPKPRATPKPRVPAKPPAAEAPTSAPAPTLQPSPTSALVTPLTEGAAQAPPTPSIHPPVEPVSNAEYLLRPVELNVSQWPLLRLDYSIERKDRSPFTGLPAADIQITLDGKPISISPADLKFKGSASSGILLVIDMSRSMTRDQEGISKLAATKEALLALVTSINAQEKLGIIAFDINHRIVLAPTHDRQALRTAIQTLALSADSARGTSLYDAADFALQFAQTNGLHNVIMLSDGCEYSPESKQHRQAGTLSQFKTQREQAIAEASRRSGVRLFTVAIGEQDSTSPLHVDARSLENLTKGTMGGFSSFIDLPALLKEANGDRQQYAALLVNQLKQVLERIQQSFQFDYSLLLRNAALPAPDNQAHKVVVSFRVGNTQLPLEFFYTWKTGAAQPVMGEWKVLTPVLIEPPTVQTSRQHLLGIFAALLFALGVLALIPKSLKAVERWKERRKLRNAVVTLSADSTHQFEGNKTCLNEGNEPGGSGHFKTGDMVVICPNCQKVHHLSCWHLSRDRCWNRLCGYELKIPRELFG